VILSMINDGCFGPLPGYVHRIKRFRTARQ
jgi:hypothetical protein